MSPRADRLRHGLAAEEVLTTTRSVRKRLDFDHPVPGEPRAECVRVAPPAPSGANRWLTRFDSCWLPAIAASVRRGRR